MAHLAHLAHFPCTRSKNTCYMRVRTYTWGQAQPVCKCAKCASARLRRECPEGDWRPGIPSCVGRMYPRSNTCSSLQSRFPVPPAPGPRPRPTCIQGMYNCPIMGFRPAVLRIALWLALLSLQTIERADYPRSGPADGKSVVRPSPLALFQPARRPPPLKGGPIGLHKFPGITGEKFSREISLPSANSFVSVVPCRRSREAVIRDPSLGGT
jgi:hypothetical protein